MTEHEALELVGHLICNTNGWDDAAVIAWTNQLAALGDQPAAQRAVQTLINSWTSTSRPPWGRLMEHYRAVPRDNGHQLGGGQGPITSYAEHLAKLRLRADNGDHAAAAEYDTFQRTTGTSNTFATHAARYTQQIGTR